MKNEIFWMENFIEIIKYQKHTPKKFKIYQDMVFFRYYETLKNIFPILSSKLGNKLFTKLIKEFITKNNYTPYIYNIAYDFVVFVNQQNLKPKHPYIEDLLWFELSEFELLRENFKNTNQTNPKFIRQISYNIHKNDFKTKTQNYLILYYDFKTNQVFFEEITKFTFELLNLMQTIPYTKALQIQAQTYDLEYNKLKKITDKLVKTLGKKHILKNQLKS